MSSRQKILIAFALLVLFNFILVIIFGDNGLVDLYLLRGEKKNIVRKNELLQKKNMSLFREIDRLKHDPQYIENVARQELGMIGKDELIFKLKDKDQDLNEP
ncbi:MAG: septum formation initiator family protein [Desulfobacterales bacterium]